MLTADSGLERAGAGRTLVPMRPAAAAFAIALLVTWALGSCAPRATPEQIAAARQDRAQSLILSGNEAYRIGDYRLAARRYAAAAVVKKNDPAAYFGMGMALSKLGRDEEARTAYARARELSRTNAVLVGPHGAHGAPTETIPDRKP
jgi:Tfp pilus assembly protein PilF